MPVSMSRWIQVKVRSQQLQDGDILLFEVPQTVGFGQVPPMFCFLTMRVWAFVLARALASCNCCKPDFRALASPCPRFGRRKATFGSVFVFPMVHSSHKRHPSGNRPAQEEKAWHGTFSIAPHSDTGISYVYVTYEEDLNSGEDFKRRVQKWSLIATHTHTQQQSSHGTNTEATHVPIGTRI
jgi:hypothetical protein